MKSEDKNNEAGQKEAINANDKNTDDESNSQSQNEEVNADSSAETQIDEIKIQIKNLMERGEKQEASALYLKVQEFYKNTPKEQKQKILGKCIEIQKILGGK